MAGRALLMACVAAAVAPEQLARLAMQAELATGWGTWWRPNALAATLLPEGATATAGLCELASGKCMDPDTAFKTMTDIVLTKTTYSINID